MNEDDHINQLKILAEDLEIRIPIHYWKAEKIYKKHYDFEEMANELENFICGKLNVNVSITISEVEEE